MARVGQQRLGELQLGIGLGFRAADIELRHRIVLRIEAVGVDACADSPSRRGRARSARLARPTAAGSCGPSDKARRWRRGRACAATTRSNCLLVMISRIFVADVGFAGGVRRGGFHRDGFGRSCSGRTRHAFDAAARAPRPDAGLVRACGTAGAALAGAGETGAATGFGAGSGAARPARAAWAAQAQRQPEQRAWPREQRGGRGLRRGVDHGLGRRFGARRTGERLRHRRRIGGALQARARRVSPRPRCASPLAAATAALRIRGAAAARHPTAVSRGNGCRCRSGRSSTKASACCPACCSRARRVAARWNSVGACGAADAVLEAVRISASAVPARNPRRMLSGCGACDANSTRSGPDRDAATPASRCNAGHFQLNAAASTNCPIDS